MTKSKTTSSSKITACPECDSGNLHFEGSSVECLSCGWKHTAAKPQRTSPKAKSEAPKAAASVAAQLTAAVQKAPAAKAKGERTRQVPTTVLVLAKDFNPRTNQLGEEGTEKTAGRWAQRENWVTVTGFLAAHGGKATYEELVNAILSAAKVGGYEKTCNARGFVQGRVRGGHLAAAK